MKIRAVTPPALAGALALAGVLAIPGSAHATLHGFCDTSDAGCVDNGTNTPTTLNPPNFGFSAGGHSATGDLMIDILVPDNVSNPSTTYTISGSLVGASTFTASLFSPTAWTSGALDASSRHFGKPKQPDRRLLPSAQTFQPSATGFFVYAADLGTQTLPSNSGASNSDPCPSRRPPAGFLRSCLPRLRPMRPPTAVAIFETGLPGTTRGGAVPEPTTWAMMLLGFAGLGFAGYRKAQGGRIAPSVA